MSEVQELTNSAFDEFIKNGLVLIDFFAEWCMPCMMMIPTIDELAEKFKGKIKFGKVDVSDNQEIAQRFNINSIPNFILFKDSKPIETFVGAMSADDFEEKLNSFL